MTDRPPNRRADNVASDDTPLRRIRLDDDIWERYEVAVKRLDPDSNRSANLRRYIRWIIGDIDEPPQRPEPRRTALREDQP
jgi:hypothetical protein